MDNITIQRLNPTYADAYRALMLEAYACHPDAFTSSVAERVALPLSWWEKRLDERADAKDMVLGALAQGQLIGVAGLSFETREKAAHKATLFGMYVPLAYRGRGIGAQLVQAVLAQARFFPQVLLVQLTVTEGNVAAHNLYAAQGFQVFGVEPMAVRVGDGFVNKVHMWCVLRSSPNKEFWGEK